MKQNKIIKILTAVLIVLLIAIVAVGVWSNQKRESREDKSNESQPVTEELSTEEQTKELPKVENDPQQVTEESPLYLALSRFALETDVKADETLSLMVEAAEEGNADAQYFAGEMFLQGIGTKPDIEKAAKYLKQAYDNGNEHAFAIYGKLCFMGDGLRQSYEQAYEAFYNLSKPTPEVICAMGIMNIYGMGVRPDYEQARNYLSTAESAGDIIATTAKQSIKNATYKRRPSEIEIEIRQKTVNIVDYSTQESELIELVDTAYKKIALQENYDKFIQDIDGACFLSQKLLALNPHLKSWHKSIGMYLSILKSTGKCKMFSMDDFKTLKHRDCAIVQVKKLLKLVSLGSLFPFQIRNRFEDVLDELCQIGIIQGWSYKNIDEEMLCSKNWLFFWRLLSIKVAF